MSRTLKSPQQLDHHQLVLTRKRMTDEALAEWLQPPERPASPRSSSTPTPSSTDQDPSAFIKKIVKKNKKIRSLTDQVAALKQSLGEAVTRVKHMEMEQQQFFEDVQEMKAQFDRLSDAHRKVLWEYLPARDADMRAIPPLDTRIEETPTRVGRYPLEQVLGYGQYAVVYSSSSSSSSSSSLRPLAIKAIDKNKVADLVSLHRIHSEISALLDPAIQHPCILSLQDVVHTRTHVYLVTERGGKDLFEFFGAHSLGIDEPLLKPLMLQVAQAVSVLHRHNYCHRDLKPENILYSPGDVSANSSTNSGRTDANKAPHVVKLIDFGLCTKAVTPEYSALRDFCGSPGFFAPEMLLADSYDGFKADVWSLGCILLEASPSSMLRRTTTLVLGNTAFSADWMAIYELAVLKDHERFAEYIRTGLARTRDFCHSAKWTYSSKLRHLLLSVLTEHPAERLTVQQVLEHPWFTSDAALMASYGASPSCGSTTAVNDALAPDPALFSLCDGSPSPMLARRPSPSKIKSLSTSSAPSVNALRLGDAPASLSASALEPRDAHASHPSSVRPLSPAISSSSSLALALAMAEEDALPTPPAAVSSSSSSSSSSGKVSLPSLSPEKPSGQRSPDRSFAKRPAHERPTSPKF